MEELPDDPSPAAAPAAPDASAGGSATESSPVEATADSAGQVFVIQAGAYEERANADEAYEKLKAVGWDPYIDTVEVGGASYFAVRVGHYSDRASAEAAVKSVSSAVGKPAQVRILKEIG